VGGLLRIWHFPEVGMADNKLMPMLLLGGAAFAVYELFLKPATVAASSSATPTPASAPASTPASSTPSGLSLDSIYQKLVASNPDFSKSGFTATQDQFNYYLGQVAPFTLDAASLTAAFGSSPQQITLAQFWAAASTWLGSNKGLSGIRGRGFAGVLCGAGVRR
jgi:hypothetical protein